MTPSRFGGGCMGWTFAIVFWCVALAAITIVFPIVIIGWVIIIGGVLAAFGASGGEKLGKSDTPHCHNGHNYPN